MKKVTLGKTELQVSGLCLGTDSIGSKIDQKTSFELLDFFFEQGGCFLDTANFYASWLEGCQGGESESAIGAWSKARDIREQLVIGSKLGFEYPGCPGGLSAEQIEHECEKSLRRLQTDHIDLYYAHRDDPATPQEETMEAFDRLRRAGKIRAIGASNIKVWRIAEANMTSRLQDLSSYDVIQQRHTYLRPRHGADFGPQVPVNEDLRDMSRQRNIALIGYSVLLQGAYMRSDRAVPAQYAGPDSDKRLAMLNAVAREAERSVNQVVIAWMRQSQPSVLPIIAGSRIDQLAENIAALELTLTDDQMNRLNSAGDPQIEQAWIQ